MDLLEDGNAIDRGHWYYRHKYLVIERAIELVNKKSFTLSDIGAGSAIFSQQVFEKYPDNKFYAIDINYSEEQLNCSSGNFTYTRDLVPADIYLLNDVLEHIENPRELLESIHELSDSPYTLIVTVPAHKILWSSHDIFLGHYRRYTKNNLLNYFQNKARYRVLDSHYLYQTLFPVAFFTKKLKKSKSKSQLKSHNTVVNFILNKILVLETYLNLRFPFGVSLVAIIDVSNPKHSPSEK
jgi:hypothetical protein